MRNFKKVYDLCVYSSNEVRSSRLIASNNKISHKFHKVFVCLSLIFLIGFYLFSVPKKANALADLDQVCSTGVAGSSLVIYLSHEPGQIFVPTRDTLDAVTVRVKGEIGASPSVTASVMDYNTGATVATKTQTVPTTESWVIFDYNDVPIPYGIYVLILRNGDSQTHSTWKAINNADCDAIGSAIWDNANHTEADMGYGVYTYNASSGTPSGGTSQPDSTSENPAGNASNANNQTSTSGSNKPPASNTTKNIAPPSDLVASDVLGDSGGAIKLTWKLSSTSAIDGYKVFRSLSPDKDFVNIAITPRITAGYIDKTVENNKTYYYMVRAYKGGSESVNSNIASAKALDDKSEILNNHKNSSGGVLGGLLGESLWAIIAILFLLFIGFAIVIGVIIVIIRSRKNN